METFLNITSFISILLLCGLGIKVLTFVVLSLLHFKDHKKVSRKRLSNYKPLVSIIVPCYNEELVLENCINSLLKQDYTNLEIVIVDDGSTDNTRVIGKKLSKLYRKVKFVSKKNGGKASALNYGINKAQGEIIVTMDADSMFLKNSIRQLVLSFYDPEVVAVGGSVKVANRTKLLNKHQAVEYITGLNLQRRAFAHLGCMQVISGAIGGFRKSTLENIGGYSSDTIVEDMDITISMSLTGGKVIYNGNAIAYTEAPESIRDFIKQRYRWTIGGFQVLKKYKNVIFNHKHDNLGTIGIPYFMIFPWIDVIISSLFFVAIIRVLLGGNWIELLAFYTFMCLIQGTLMLYSLILDKEDKRLIFIAGFESLWYNHLISFITVKAGYNFLRGSTVSWNKFSRLGKNYAPLAS